MKTLFEQENHVNIHQINQTNLLDTCYLVYALSHPKELEDIKNLNSVSITSFNVEELLHIAHKIKAGHRHILKRLIKEVDFNIIDIDVHPGDKERERQFIENIDLGLLQHVHDPSDAVLVAVGIRTKSNVYTRDKHHLFNIDLENYLNKYDIKILNIIK